MAIEKKEGDIREIARRTQAKTLLAHLNRYQIQRMAAVGKVYLDLRRVALDHDIEYSRDQYLSKALRANNVSRHEKHLYLAGSGKKKHVSRLRMEVAIAICDGQYGGLDGARRIFGDNFVYPFPAAMREAPAMEKLKHIVDHTPDYATVNGRCTFPGQPDWIDYKHDDSDKD
jgi:hypothetical protein